VEVVNALGVFATVLGYGESITDSDALDHQHAVVRFDLADRLNVEPLTLDLDLTRLQRAGEGAGQSAAGGGDDVVERGGVRRVLIR
jgi:hypothetical protein